MMELGEARGFLHRLLKYAPRKGRTPREDFFTEALTGYLNVVPQAFPVIIEYGRKRRDLDFSVGGGGKDLRFETQQSWPGHGRPDLVVCGPDDEVVCVVECKMGAPFTARKRTGSGSLGSGDDKPEKQVPGYCQAILEEGHEAKVVLISLVLREREVLEELSKEQRPFYAGNMLWGDVHDALLHTEISLEGIAAALHTLVLNLMEDMGMTEPDKLNKEHGRAYLPYSKALVSMERMVQEVAEQLESAWGFRVASLEKRSAWYRCQNVEFGKSLGIGFCMEFDEDNEDIPLWPYVYVVDGYTKTQKAIDLLTKKHGKKNVDSDYWSGLCVYPKQGDMPRFFEATDFASQVSEFVKFGDAVLKELESADIVRRKRAK